MITSLSDFAIHTTAAHASSALETLGTSPTARGKSVASPKIRSVFFVCLVVCCCVWVQHVNVGCSNDVCHEIVQMKWVEPVQDFLFHFGRNVSQGISLDD